LLLVGCGDNRSLPDCACGAGWRCCDNDTICVPEAKSCDEVTFPDLLSGVWISTNPAGEPQNFKSLFYVERDGTCGWHRSNDGGKSWEKLLTRWELGTVQGTVDSVTRIKITVLQGDPQLKSVEFQLQRKDGAAGFKCEDLPAGLTGEMPCYLWCAPQVDCANDKNAPGQLFLKCGADPTAADACGISSGITPLIQ
jgi:hypothetical protein